LNGFHIKSLSGEYVRDAAILEPVYFARASFCISSTYDWETSALLRTLLVFMGYHTQKLEQLVAGIVDGGMRRAGLSAQG